MNRLFERVDWSVNANIYEVNLRQYSQEGTFTSFIRELPRLKDMGITILWFMPITPISMEKRLGSLGSYYACSSYLQTNPEYGTIEDFKQLVRSIHDLGMKVIIDWVANHTGWDHEWTRTHPAYYKRNDQGSFYDNHNWADVIDLNYYDQLMRKEMVSSMAFWINECGIDGFRCDMAHLVPLDFWRDARDTLDQIKPLFWLGETEEYNYQAVFDCSYAWSWMHMSVNYVRGGAGIEELKALLVSYQQNIQASASYLFFTTNHDENSWNGTEYEKYGDAALAMAVLSCMWNGDALVYSGQELPNRRRLKFFDKDVIEWKDRYELHGFYKTLLQTRTSFGTSIPLIDILQTGGDRQLVAFRRTSPEKELLVVINLSGSAKQLQLDDGLLSGSYTDLMSGTKKEAPSLNNLLMEPWTYLILVNR